MSRQRSEVPRESGRKRISVFTKAELCTLMWEQGVRFAFDANGSGDYGEAAVVMTGERRSVGWPELSGTTKLRLFQPAGSDEVELWQLSEQGQAKKLGLRPMAIREDELPQKVAEYFLTTLMPVRSSRREVALVTA